MLRNLLIAFASLTLLTGASAVAVGGPDGPTPEHAEPDLPVPEPVALAAPPMVVYEAEYEIAAEAERVAVAAYLAAVEAERVAVEAYLEAVRAELAKRRAPVATRAPSGVPRASDGSVWDRLAACECGGNPSCNTGNGYYGTFQFSLPTWQSVGGDGLPSDASYEEQLARAQDLQARAGFASQWPGCSAKLGLG
jgi:hypothetical protein